MWPRVRITGLNLVAKLDCIKRADLECMVLPKMAYILLKRTSRCRKGHSITLVPGGLYITEDIMWNDVDEWCDRRETIYLRQYPKYEFAFVILANRGYNNLLAGRRGANQVLFAGGIQLIPKIEISSYK